VGEFLGLKWRFTGTKTVDNNGAIRYHYLNLVTKNYDYSLEQADGCRLQLEFDALSKDPIIFTVSNFSLKQGISLTASVSQQPVEINGIETKFKFDEASFTIKENHLHSFNLHGSGTLPPALVGDAAVSIDLQFEE